MNKRQNMNWPLAANFEATNVTFLPKKLASNVQSTCIDNSKRPKSKLWHYCIKATIYLLTHWICFTLTVAVREIHGLLDDFCHKFLLQMIISFVMSREQFTAWFFFSRRFSGSFRLPTHSRYAHRNLLDFPSKIKINILVKRKGLREAVKGYW